MNAPLRTPPRRPAPTQVDSGSHSSQDEAHTLRPLHAPHALLPTPSFTSLILKAQPGGLTTAPSTPQPWLRCPRCPWTLLEQLEGQPWKGGSSPGPSPLISSHCS